jgi:hypothetical protein
LVSVKGRYQKLIANMLYLTRSSTFSMGNSTSVEAIDNSEKLQKQFEEETVKMISRQKLIDPIIDQTNQKLFAKIPQTVTTNSIHPYSDLIKHDTDMLIEMSKLFKAELAELSKANLLEILRFFHPAAEKLTETDDLKTEFADKHCLNEIQIGYSYIWRPYVMVDDYGPQSPYDYGNLSLGLYRFIENF